MKILNIIISIIFSLCSVLSFAQTTTIGHKAVFLIGSDDETELAKPQEEANFKKKYLSEGTEIEILKVESGNHHQMVYVASGKKKGWVHRYCLKEIWKIANLIPEIRKEYLEDIKNKNVRLGMNTEEALLSIGIPGEEVKNKEDDNVSSHVSLAGGTSPLYWKIKLYKDKLVYYQSGFNKRKTIEYKQTTNWELINVEKPSDDKNQFSGIKKINVQNEQGTKYSYEDDHIQIEWNVSRYSFPFELKNKSSHSIKMIWDDAVYVDIFGKSNRLVHTGIKYDNKDLEQPNSVVPRNSSLSDALTPADNIFFMGQWLTHPLINDFLCEEQAEDLNIKGKKVIIILPIQIKDITNEYAFTFKLKDIIFQNKQNVLNI